MFFRFEGLDGQREQRGGGAEEAEGDWGDGEEGEGNTFQGYDFKI